MRGCQLLYYHYFLSFTIFYKHRVVCYTILLTEQLFCGYPVDSGLNSSTKIASDVGTDDTTHNRIFFFFFGGEQVRYPKPVWTGLNERRNKCLLILFWLGSEARVMIPMWAGIFIVWPFLEVPREGRPGISYQLAQRQGKSGKGLGGIWKLSAVKCQKWIQTLY